MFDARVFEDPYSKNQPSEKSKHKRLGPFRILELVGSNAVRLDLPGHSRIHPVVNVSHTSPYFAQPSDIRNPLGLPLPPVHPEYLDEYYSEAILAHRTSRNDHQFLVSWKGYPSHESTWEPTSHFISEHESIRESLIRCVTDDDILEVLPNLPTLEGSSSRPPNSVSQGNT